MLLTRIVGSYQTYVYTKIAMETAHKKLSIEKNTQKIEENKIELIDGVNIKNVSYKYKDKKFIIRNLSQNISKGDILAISGSIGSGKSTLLDLITGFKIPNNGNIYIGKYNVHSNSKISLKK